MNPDEWIGKSIKTEKKLSTERYQRFVELMGREDDYVAEKGDPLPPYGHWLYPADEAESDPTFLPPLQGKKYYWYEGTLESDSTLRVDESCQKNLKITDIRELPDQEDSWLISLSQTIHSDGRRAAGEQLQILYTDHESSIHDVRRISFEPDWVQDVRSDQVASLKKLAPKLAGVSILDILSNTGDSAKDGLTISGPIALVLLLESFDYHFDSRAASSVTYKASGFSPDEGPFLIGGRDSDSYVTDLCILNSRKQALFSASIRWSSTWGTSRF